MFWQNTLKVETASGSRSLLHAANTQILVGVFVAIVKRNFTDYRILCMPTCTDGEPYSGAEKSTRSFTG